ncbi:hypothetical protein O4J56_18400 [Nocardiopsis sp. RSe5-2]|uniref:Lipoprotein n=1 Tax=Nocardiopsis endophytica TaxID=3018445 RepID=A0ABT4U6P4_9ACTN|nr:hypothetical protein [Nocardiopsis endophytica]MDA2812621.1 hypothetical protein [Nocardiopsis endophytica]
MSSRLRSGRPLGYAAAAAAVALAAAGCSLDLSDLRPGGGEQSQEEAAPVEAAPVLEGALKRLEAADAIAVQGKVAAGGEDEGVNDAALTVTSGGTVQGTYQEGENEAEVLEAEGRVFLKAPDEFWLDQDIANPDSDQYAGAWVRVAKEQLGLDPGARLAPAELAATLEGLGAASEEAQLEDLDGTPAYRVDLGGGEKNRVWISEEEPYTLLRMEIEDLSAGGQGGSEGSEDAEGGEASPSDDASAADAGGSGARVQFNLSEPEAADVEGVYDTAIAAAKDELTSSRDARIELNWQGQIDLQCQTGGACTVSGTAEDVSDGGGEGKVIVRMNATFKNDELGEKKCDSTEVLAAGSTVDMSCSVDYALEPSTEPKDYEINATSVLSTQGLSKKSAGKVADALEEQKKALSESGGGSGGEDASAEESPAEGGGN